jgi:hypothetical protein
VDPRALFIPSCQGVTGLTSAFDLSDQYETLVGFVSGNCHVHVLWALKSVPDVHVFLRQFSVANMAPFAICSS